MTLLTNFLEWKRKGLAENLSHVGCEIVVATYYGKKFTQLYIIILLENFIADHVTNTQRVERDLRIGSGILVIGHIIIVKCVAMFS